MKKILFSSLILFGLYAHAQINVTASAGTATATYTTLKNAFDAINTGVHQGDINLSVTANTTETAVAVLNASTTYTSIIIKPTAAVTIGGAVASNPVVRILGSNVTIDGSSTAGGTTRDLTFSNTSTTSPSVFFMGSATSTAPLTNVVVKNAVFINGGNGTTNFVIANGTTTAGFFNNITVQNNDVRTGFNGIFILADTTAAANGNNLLITGNTVNTNIVQNGILVSGVGGTSTVSNNIIGITRTSSGTSASPAGSLGINIGAGTNNVSIYGNTISAKNTSATATGVSYATGIAISSGAANVSTKVYNNTISEISGILGYVNSSGIYLGGATPNVSIYSNKISGLKNNNTVGNPMQGILLGSSSTAANTVVYNNVISDVLGTGASQVSGIYAFAGAGYKVYNNTVNLNTSNAETGTTAAMYVHANITAASALDIRNNIFANTRTAGNRYSIYSAAANTVFGNINYNDYSTTGTALGFIGSDRTTLTDIQTGFGGNANSLNLAPVFVSATDLHLSTSSNSGLDNKGTPLPEVTVDFGGATRGAAPDMGAYEFTYSALAVSDVNKANPDITVYPNPFMDVLKISDVKGIKSIHIIDPSGRNLKMLTPAKELDLGDLKAGLYMISLEFENGTTKALKVIKK
ncbi:hypothetical protein ACM46_03355 [Chryseobacterium angstadtii]|uniref:Secretion system C-terminal sorting domain-containing protein n=1 Tax=Chryseobacterium angstadtii TaxID=558151 RepID=A0A0J7IJV5_9FLAO|nr:T9SS type A sorting domain-containing protein [Chryseobacterium angstadtii]KMQ66578.1 hypothetical protein ACM46_03355 [Chryseobacterium angstadtii]